jgi:NTE family protein
VTIEGFLRQLTMPALHVRDFDQLPIPFRAVAADIETGQGIVLASGNLTQALRASMAIPGAVAPVELDGRLLVDGGIANNLPIELARQTCKPDVVIAVNISTPSLERSQITSALGIVGQLINLLGKEAVDRQIASLKATDVLIQPELGDISAGSFARQLEAIRIGEQAARAAAPRLAGFGVSREAYAAYRERQQAAARATPQVDVVRFEGHERTQPEVLADLVQTQPGTELSVQRVNSDLRRIYGRGDFEAVDVRIDATTAGTALTYVLREKSTGPNYLRFGLALGSDFESETGFNALFSYRKTWLNDAGAEWLTDLQVGRDNVLFTEFYQPLARRGDYFVAPYALASRTLHGVFSGETRVAEYGVNEFRTGVDLGLTLGTWGEARAGLSYRKLKASITTGSAAFPEVENSVTGLRMRVIGDSFDTPWFPRSGHRFALSAFYGAEGSGDSGRFNKAEASWSGAYSSGAHTFAATLLGGTGFNSEIPIGEFYSLGGPLRLSGYRTEQFAGQRMMLATARYYRQLVRLPSLLGSGLFFGGSAEVGRMDRQFGTNASTGTLWSTSLFLGAETFLGPMHLGVGYGGQGTTLYLLLGVGTF